MRDQYGTGEMEKMMPEKDEWDGSERRSGVDRRRGQDRRINRGDNLGGARGKKHAPMDRSRTSPVARGRDRRIGQDRRRQVLKGRQQVCRSTSPFHAYLDAHPQVRVTLERRMKEYPAYRHWLRGLNSIVPAAVERRSTESKEASTSTPREERQSGG
jgi:hypothetical protein